jgi:hypothetical protein
MATATQRAEDADRSAGTGEVTLPQKMLSAVSGSVLTSLLGAYINYSFRYVPDILGPMYLGFRRHDS